MGEDLDDLENIQDLDDVDGGEPVDLSEKQRAKASCESRRRLERKLEEARMQKQVQEYDFDDDYD
ncbi:MAG: PA3496 family putative envelope integrity protein [Porticoccaceae bacterium]